VIAPYYQAGGVSIFNGDCRDVMRWLCRLVTPPGGVVLDPFNGSGTTGMAALDEGFRYIGIEREERYCAISVDRITHRHLLEVRTVEPTEQAPMGRLL
jgi:DNA modification methylase